MLDASILNEGVADTSSRAPDSTIIAVSDKDDAGAVSGRDDVGAASDRDDVDSGVWIGWGAVDPVPPREVSGIGATSNTIFISLGDGT
jgi:hypothetical protein